jgi:hypothetical protein
MGRLFESKEVAVASSVKIAPPNSLIFVSDIDGGMPPYPVRGGEILSTGSCISIGCYPEVDGETEITLGSRKEVDPGGAPIFDGTLETPNRVIVISTVDGKAILREKVSGTTTRVRAWLNRRSLPDTVIVGFE